MSEPPVIGIDTNTWGFHVVSDKLIVMPDFQPGFYGWSKAESKDAAERRHVIYGMAYEFFKTLPKSTAVFIEEALVLRTNIETTRKLVMVAGVIEAAFWQACPDATLFWVDVSAWRKKVLGVGSGSTEKLKELAKRYVQNGWSSSEHVQLEAAFEKQLDLYDAACICAYGRMVLAEGTVHIR